VCFQNDPLYLIERGIRRFQQDGELSPLAIELEQVDPFNRYRENASTKERQLVVIKSPPCPPDTLLA
jgi:hypothetical protein